MRRILDAAVWLAIFLCGGLLAAMLAYPVFAQEILLGKGLVCNTAEQVEEFIVLASNDAEDALKQVNEKAHDASACGILSVAFIEGDVVKTITGEHAGRIVQIGIVGVEVNGGWLHIKPFVQFTFYVTEQEKS